MRIEPAARKERVAARPWSVPAELAERPGAELAQALWAGKWIILAAAIIAGVLAAAIAAQMRPIYRASAMVLIEGTRPNTNTAPSEVVSGITAEATHMQTQAEILRSGELASRVIRRLDLASHREFDPRQAPMPRWEEFTRRYAEPIAALVLGPRQPARAPAEASLVRRFARELSVQPLRQSQLVRITFDSPDRELAARIVNTLAEEYARADVESRSSASRAAAAKVNGRLAELRTELVRSEQALQDFRSQQGLLDSKSTVLSGAGAMLEGMTQRLVEARVRRAQADTAYQQAQGAGRVAPAVMRDALVQRARDLEADAERRFAELARQYGPEHPRYKVAESEVAGARAHTTRQVATLVAALTEERNAALTNERALEDSIAKVKELIQDINRQEGEVAALERDVATNRQLLQEFLTRSKEAAVALEPEIARSRLVDRAVPPADAIRPATRAMVASAMVLGLLLGLLYALARQRLDTTIRSDADVEARLARPFLGALPRIAGDLKSNLARAVLDHPQDLYAESIRTIATGVQLSSLESLRKVVAVTSSVGEEGKSSFAINFAFARAKVARVLLLEADMRAPSLARKWLFESPAQPGLAELVAGEASLEECLLQVEGTGLHVILAGAAPADPHALLESARFTDTIAGLRERYDLIVIDCAPVNPVADTLMVAALCTGVIYVVRAGHTPVARIRKGLRKLESIDVAVFGIVLNQCPRSMTERYYGTTPARAFA